MRAGRASLPSPLWLIDDALRHKVAVIAEPNEPLEVGLDIHLLNGGRALNVLDDGSLRRTCSARAGSHASAPL